MGSNQDTTEPVEPMPVITRVGDTVVMSAADFDDLIARLLIAERGQRPSLRSWLRP